MKSIVSTPNAPAAIGPYSQAVILNGTVYVSGQLPINPNTGIMATGIENQTRQSMDNVAAILNAAGSSLSDVAKVTVLLADMGDFAAMNTVYAEYFPTDAPARVCFQAAALPKNALIEIDAVAGVNSCDAHNNSGEVTPSQKSLVDILYDKGVSKRALTLTRNLEINSLEQLSQYSKAELRKVPNIGRKTIGELEAILRENGMSFRYSEAYLNYISESSESPNEQTGQIVKRAWELTSEIFMETHSVEDVQNETGFTQSTIGEHLVKAISKGVLTLEESIDEQTINTIREYIESNPDVLSSGRLKPIYEGLDGQVEYWQIRAVLNQREKENSEIEA